MKSTSVRETDDRKERDTGRRAHLKDFRMGEDGSYHYEGKVFHAHIGKGGETAGQLTDPAVPEEAFREHLRRMWKAGAVLVPALVVIGTLPAEVMGDKAYLLIPFVLETILVVRILWAMYRITAGGGRLREYQYQTSAARQPLRCRLLEVLAGLSMVLGVVRVLTAAEPVRTGPMAVWFAMQAALLLTGAVLGKMHKALCWS